LTLIYRALAAILLLVGAALTIHRIILVLEAFRWISFDYMRQELINNMVRSSGDIGMLLLGGLILFGIAESLARTERIERLLKTRIDRAQRAAALPKEPPVPVPLPPPVKSSRFPTESAFADYVSTLLNGWRGWYAISKRNEVLLLDGANVEAVCVVSLAARNEYIAPHTFSRLMELRRGYPRKIFMIATLGKFDDNAVIEADRARVQLLDGDDLDKLELSLKTGSKPPANIS
jgi:hypothetical protein